MDSHKLFVEVVEAGSFSLAAKRLHKSPSAISKSMSALEEQLGVQLFIRTTRTLSLTEPGEIYYDRCLDIVNRVEETRAELLEYQGKPSGRISITWPNGLAYSAVSEALGLFIDANPFITLDVRASTDAVNLVEARVDFAFRVGQPDDSNLIAIKLDDLQPIMCASPRFLSRHGSQLKKEGLFSVPNLIPTYMNFVQRVKKTMPDQQIDLQEHHLVDDIASLYNLAKQGLGVAFLFKHITQKDLDCGDLVDLSAQQPLPPASLYLIYPKLSFQPRKNRSFIDHFRSYYGLSKV